MACASKVRRGILRSGVSDVLMAATVAVLLGWPGASWAQTAVPAPGDLPRILTHDNLTPAGKLEKGVLTLHLKIGEGAWYPNAEDGAWLPVLAFGEEGGALMIPGPPIRVAQGTEIHVSVHNTMPIPAMVHGLDQRPGDGKSVLQIPPGQTREASFQAGAPGTYYYWANSGDQDVALDSRLPENTQLDGAFIVDPPGAPINDRIMVIGLWYQTLVPFDVDHGAHELLTVNGRAWPHTTRLTYNQGETAHWRVINPSVSEHPMHLHGAYYRVDSKGDGERDSIYAADQQRLVVTESMREGQTMAVTWTPEHSGNWIFHCHLAAHFAADLASTVEEVMGVHQGESHHADTGMAGLVIGITVRPAKIEPTPASGRAVRRITMTLSERPAAAGIHKCISVELNDGAHSVVTVASAASGPPLVLHSGEPTEITVVNHLSQPTAIHWHGIELESYYDGVPGVGGDSRQVTPSIQPGTSFVAKMTPPRAGTFIYHTHWHDIGQLTGGLYGPMIVLPPGEDYDPAIDKVFLVSREGPDDVRDPVLLNGSNTPPGQQWQVGTRYRLRFINITPNNGGMTFFLRDGDKPVQWLPVGKDGADLPPAQRVARDAKQRVSVGETYDFEYQPTAAGSLVVDLYRPFDKTHVKIPVQVVGAARAAVK